mgnify:CR=1 FL=1
MEPGHLLTAILQALDGRGHRVCVLRGHESLRGDVASEVELLGTTECRQALEEVLAQDRFCLVHASRRVHACRYVITDPSGSVVLRLGFATEFYRAGKVWVDTAEILSSAQRYQTCWVPGPRYQFTLSIVDSILWGDPLTTGEGHRLSQLYGADPQGCTAQLRRLLPERGVAVVREAAISGSWQAYSDRVATLRRMLLGRATARDPARMLRHWVDLRRGRLRRLLRPAGLVVAFLGSDGVGKSTIIRRVEEAVPRVLLSPRRFHLRPYFGRVRTGFVPDPHGQKERGWIGSVAKLLLWWTDYLVSYVSIVYPAMVKSSLVIFDRYYEDLLVDPKRYRYGGPSWLARLGRRLVPDPHLFIVLDAPPETVYRRKQEVPLDELVRLREGYRMIGRSLANAHVVDASQPVDSVAQEVMRILLRRISERYRKYAY